MSELLRALGDPGMPFLRYAFVAGVLASLAFGVVVSSFILTILIPCLLLIGHDVGGLVQRGMEESRRRAGERPAS